MNKKLNTYNSTTFKELLSYLYKYKEIQSHLRTLKYDYLPESFYEENPTINLMHLVAGYDFNQKYDHLFPSLGNMLLTIPTGISDENIAAMLLQKSYNGIQYGKLPVEVLFSPFCNIHATSGLHASHSLRAVGLARALKTYQSKGISICSLSYDDLSEGNTLEAIYGSEKEQVPIIYLVEGDTLEELNFTGPKNLYIIKCDSSDITDCINASRKARNIAKDENLPVMILSSISEKNRLEKIILEIEQLVTDKIKLSVIKQLASDSISKVFEKAEQLSSPKYSQILQHINSPTYINDNELEEYFTTDKNVINSIYDTIKNELPKHNHSYYLRCKTDNNTNDKQFISTLEKHIGTHRVLNLKSSNNYLLSTASGMTLYNKQMITVIEMVSADSFLSCLATLREIAFRSWESDGSDTPSIIIRIPTGGYTNEGPYGSSNIESFLTNIPGIRVLYPSYAEDFAGFLRTAIRSKGITVIFEPKAIYSDSIAKNLYPKNKYSPFGKGIIRREGTDLTMITYGNATHLCMQVARKMLNEQNISVEIFELRSLLPIDKTGIIQSVSKTKRAIIIHESYLFGGLSAEIASMLNKECYNIIEKPIERTGALFAPIPHHHNLEKVILPSINSIYNAVFELIEE